MYSKSHVYAMNTQNEFWSNTSHEYELKYRFNTIASYPLALGFVVSDSEMNSKVEDDPYWFSSDPKTAFNCY